MTAQAQPLDCLLGRIFRLLVHRWFQTRLVHYWFRDKECVCRRTDLVYNWSRKLTSHVLILFMGRVEGVCSGWPIPVRWRGWSCLFLVPDWLTWSEEAKGWGKVRERGGNTSGIYPEVETETNPTYIGVLFCFNKNIYQNLEELLQGCYNIMTHKMTETGSNV